MLSWLRRDKHGGFIVCVVNLTPVVRENFRVGVPEEGAYEVVLSTDDTQYGGSGTGAQTAVSVKSKQHGRPYSIELTLPPLGALFLERH